MKNYVQFPKTATGWVASTLGCVLFYMYLFGLLPGWCYPPEDVAVAFIGSIVSAVISLAATVTTAAMSSSSTDEAAKEAKKLAMRQRAEEHRTLRHLGREQAAAFEQKEEQLEYNEDVRARSERLRQQERTDLAQQRKQETAGHLAGVLMPDPQARRATEQREQQAIQLWGV